jgi:hypothetical protein
MRFLLYTLYFFVWTSCTILYLSSSVFRPLFYCPKPVARNIVSGSFHGTLHLKGQHMLSVIVCHSPFIDTIPTPCTLQESILPLFWECTRCLSIKTAPVDEIGRFAFRLVVIETLTGYAICSPAQGHRDLLSQELDTDSNLLTHLDKRACWDPHKQERIGRLHSIAERCLGRVTRAAQSLSS